LLITVKTSLEIVLFEKIGNNPEEETYYLGRLKEIIDASFEADPQASLVNIWYNKYSRKK
jgi:hypothetical protein